jgi:hypothetical protein
MVCSIVDVLLRDDSHANALVDVLVRRQQAQMQVMGADRHTEVFAEASSIKSIDKDWVIAWLAAHSDMTPAELIIAKDKEEEAISQLVTFESQIGFNMKLPEEFAVKPVVSRVLHIRSLACGSRLQHFKARNGIKGDGHLDWSKGCYTMEFQKNGDLKIHHIGGDHVVTTKHGIVKGVHKLLDNFSDWHASFRCHPQPAIKIHLWFQKSKTGPYRLPMLTGTNKPMNEVVAAAQAQWEEAQAQAVSTLGVSAADQEQLQILERTTNKDKAVTARQAAAASMEAKRLKREISLT